METRWRTHRLRTHSSPDTFGVTPGLAGQLQTQPRLPCGRASQRGAVNSTAPRRGRAGDALQSPAVENLTALSTLDWVPAKHLSGIDGAPRPAAARWPVEMGRAPGLVAAPAPAAPPWCINHRDGTWGNAGGTARGPLSLGASPGATSSELRAGSPTSPLFQPHARRSGCSHGRALCWWIWSPCPHLAGRKLLLAARHPAPASSPPAVAERTRGTHRQSQCARSQPQLEQSPLRVHGMEGGAVNPAVLVLPPREPVRREHSPREQKPALEG